MLLKRVLVGGVALVLIASTSVFVLKLRDFRQNQSALVLVPRADVAEGEASLHGPAHIQIAKINVDSDIEYVGVSSDGSMDTPKEAEIAGWFDGGPYPGEVGSAVIAGHSSWKKGLPAIFDNLGQLRPGDKIYIEDKEGGIVTFVVRKLERYAPGADASTVFLSYDGKAHLNLVTCEGLWDATTKSSSARLVVFADKE